MMCKNAAHFRRWWRSHAYNKRTMESTQRRAVKTTRVKLKFCSNLHLSTSGINSSMISVISSPSSIIVNVIVSSFLLFLCCFLIINTTIITSVQSKSLFAPSSSSSSVHHPRVLSSFVSSIDDEHDTIRQQRTINARAHDHRQLPLGTSVQSIEKSSWSSQSSSSESLQSQSSLSVTSTSTSTSVSPIILRAPSFDDTLPVLVIASSYSPQVYLPCRVFDLANRTVSWIRKSDATLLSVGHDPFEGNDDSRFQPVDQRNDPNDWTLALKSPAKFDSDTYECQVSWAGRPLVHRVQLRVVDAKSTITIETNVTPAKLLYVRAHEQLKLTCTIEAPDVPDFVYWYRNDQVVKLEMMSSNRDRSGGEQSTSSTENYTNRGHTTKPSDKSQIRRTNQANQLVVADERVLMAANQLAAFNLRNLHNNGTTNSIVNGTNIAGSRKPDQRIWRRQTVMMADTRGQFGPLKHSQSVSNLSSDATTIQRSLSVYLVPNAQISDAGNYTCQPSNAEPSHVNVQVLENGAQSQPGKRSLQVSDSALALLSTPSFRWPSHLSSAASCYYCCCLWSSILCLFHEGQPGNCHSLLSVVNHQSFARLLTSTSVAIMSMVFVRLIHR